MSLFKESKFKKKKRDQFPYRKIKKKKRKKKIEFKKEKNAFRKQSSIYVKHFIAH